MTWSTEQAQKYKDAKHGIDGYYLLDPYIELLLRQHCPDAIVADAGCGAGRFSADALSYGAKHVTAFDKSRPMLEAAQATLANFCKEGKAIVRYEDVTDLEHLSRQFEVMISINVGCNVEDLDDFFCEASFALQYGGQFIVTGPDNLQVLFLAAGHDPKTVEDEIKHKLQQYGEVGVKDMEYVLRATMKNATLLNTSFSPIDRSGELIKRKIPGLVVDNVWHSSADYDAKAEKYGFSTEISINPRMTLKGPASEHLGSMYREFNPFFLRVYRKEK
jgi:SAM-dependent methyltransferase